MKFRKEKKGQVVITSIMMVLFLFLLVMTFFFDSIMSRLMIGQDDFKVLDIEATRLSDSILLQGYPHNWHENHPKKIGLVTNETLDLDKIQVLEILAKNEYSKSKFLLGIQNDYFINITFTNTTQEIESYIIKNPTIPLDEILEKKTVVTRNRIALVTQDNKKMVATIFIAIYSN